MHTRSVTCRDNSGDVRAGGYTYRGKIVNNTKRIAGFEHMQRITPWVVTPNLNRTYDNVYILVVIKKIRPVDTSATGVGSQNSHDAASTCDENESRKLRFWNARSVPLLITR